MLQPSAFPVGSQPAQTFQGVSCSDRQGLLLQLEQLLFRTEPSSPGRDDTHCLCPQDLPVFAQCPASWSVLGPARGAQTCRPTHPLEHTRTPRSQCSQGTPGAQRCRGSSAPQGYRARAALAPVQSGYDLGREGERPCPRQSCLQPSLA